MVTIPVDNPRLVSSAHGLLNRILIVFPQYTEKSENIELIAELFKKMPSSTKFVIWVYNDTRTIKVLEEELFHLGIDYFFYEGRLDTKDLYVGRKCCVLKAPKNFQFSAWIQDPFLVVQEGNWNINSSKCYLVEPSFDFVDIDEDHFIANHLAQLELFETFKAPLIFHGGNILVGDRFILIGNLHFELTKYHLLNGAKEKFPSFTSYQYVDMFVKNVISRFLGGDKQVIVVGDKDYFLRSRTQAASAKINKTQVRQPFIHIDMYVTLAGRTENGDYVILVGNPVAVQSKDYAIVNSMKKQIDQIAISLRREGFVVIRNPIPLTRTRVTKGNTYYCLYNNAIVEIDHSSKKVWLPTFAFDQWKEQLIEYDLENIHIWKSLDFEVITLDNFHAHVQNNGGVHCMVKFLERTI